MLAFMQSAKLHCDLDKVGTISAFGGIKLSFETATVAVIDCALVDKDWHARFLLWNENIYFGYLSGGLRRLTGWFSMANWALS